MMLPVFFFSFFFFYFPYNPKNLKSDIINCMGKIDTFSQRWIPQNIVHYFSKLRAIIKEKNIREVWGFVFVYRSLRRDYWIVLSNFWCDDFLIYLIILYFSMFCCYLLKAGFFLMRVSKEIHLYGRKFRRNLKEKEGELY